jgi:hypothetical protein
VSVVKTVRSTMLLPTYERSLEQGVTGRSDQWPASAPSRRPNTDGESNRGTHHQSIDPVRSTSAAEEQSDRKP